MKIKNIGILGILLCTNLTFGTPKIEPSPITCTTKVIHEVIAHVQANTDKSFIIELQGPDQAKQGIIFIPRDANDTHAGKVFLLASQHYCPLLIVVNNIIATDYLIKQLLFWGVKTTIQCLFRQDMNLIPDLYLIKYLNAEKIEFVNVYNALVSQISQSCSKELSTHDKEASRIQEQPLREFIEDVFGNRPVHDYKVLDLQSVN